MSFCSFLVKVKKFHTKKRKKGDASLKRYTLGLVVLFFMKVKVMAIVGGWKIPHEKFPSVFPIATYHNDEFDIVCTGTLINQNTLVTAAHCFSPLRYPLKKYGLFREGKMVATFDKVHLHPYYQKSLLGLSDLALVKVNWSSPEDIPFIEKYPLLPSWNIYDGPIIEEAHLVGFGENEERTKGEKKEAIIPIQSKNSSEIISQGKKTDSCYGDSGGPLFYYDKEKEDWFLIAVTSRGFSSFCFYGGTYTKTNEFQCFLYKDIEKENIPKHCTEEIKAPLFENHESLEEVDLTDHLISDFSPLLEYTSLKKVTLPYNVKKDKKTFLELKKRKIKIIGSKLQFTSKWKSKFYQSCMKNDKNALKVKKRIQQLSPSENLSTCLDFHHHLLNKERLDLSELKLQRISFLSDLPHLKRLNLSGNPLKDTLSLRRFKILKEVDLSWNSSCEAKKKKLANKNIQVRCRRSQKKDLMKFTFYHHCSRPYKHGPESERTVQAVMDKLQLKRWECFKATEILVRGKKLDLSEFYLQKTKVLEEFNEEDKKSILL